MSKLTVDKETLTNKNTSISGKIEEIRTIVSNLQALEKDHESDWGGVDKSAYSNQSTLAIALLTEASNFLETACSNIDEKVKSYSDTIDTFKTSL